MELLGASVIFSASHILKTAPAPRHCSGRGGVADYALALQQWGGDGEDVLVYVRDLRIEAHQSAGSDPHLEGRQLRELLHVVLVQHSALLDFHGIKRLVFLDNQIDLAGVALFGPEIEDRRLRRWCSSSVSRRRTRSRKSVRQPLPRRGPPAFSSR